MSTDGAELLFGKIAVKLGYISNQQLEQVIERQVKSDAQVSLGFLLVREQLLSQEQIDEILGIQQKSGRTSLFGRLLVDNDMVSQQQVNECLRDQQLFKRKSYDFRLGELLVKKGHLTGQGLDTVLQIQGKRRMVCPSSFDVHNVDGGEGSRPLCPDCQAPLITRLD